VARLEGLEPSAYGLEVRCSIHLSYRRTVFEDGMRESSFRRPEVDWSDTI
jgi:hypothetical protein